MWSREYLDGTGPILSMSSCGVSKSKLLLRDPPLVSRGVAGEERSWLSPDEKEGRPTGREGEGSRAGAQFPARKEERREGRKEERREGRKEERGEERRGRRGERGGRRGERGGEGEEGEEERGKERGEERRGGEGGGRGK